MIDPTRDSMLALLSAATAVLAVVVGPTVSALIMGKQIKAANQLAEKQALLLRKNANKQVVAPMRQGWITSLRERMAKLISLSSVLTSSQKTPTTGDEMAFAQARYEVLMMLNISKAEQLKLEQLINSLALLMVDSARDKEKLETCISEIVETSRQVLSHEWKRIKTDDAN